ncbi:MAG: hypothetical protein COA84_02950 [Robiginitomaculum sp.]|nr:MAG: hypothetical protein COA84_02950 [Robiginitomaculum sp.]
MAFTFLICSERAGSNLITSFMNGHKAVSGPPPSHLFRLFGLNAHGYHPLSDEANWNAFLHDITEAQKWMIGAWESAPTIEAIKAACPKRTMNCVFEYLYAQERRKNESISFVKENYTYLIVPFLLANWPDCRFVFSVRDPRDVAASWVKTRAMPGGVKRAVDVWLEDQSASLDIFHQTQPSGRMIRVRYEDLISNTEAVGHTLCTHLGIAYDPAMLNFHQDQRTKRNASRTQAWENLARPVLAGNAQKYKTVLSDADLRYVELRCARLMHVFDYALDTDADTLSPTAAEAEFKALVTRLSPGEDVNPPSPREAEQRERRTQMIKRVVARSEAI